MERETEIFDIYRIIATGVPYKFIGTRLGEIGYSDIIKNVTELYDKKEEEMVNRLTPAIYKLTHLFISGTIGFNRILTTIVKLLRMKRNDVAKHIFT